MYIRGKIYGFLIGFLFGRFPGALFGLILGHLYDKKQSLFPSSIKGKTRQELFFNSTFSVMGHVAKASGRVTVNDIKIATALMDQMKLSGDARKDAQAAFSEGKSANFDLKACLKTFKAISFGRRELLQMFLEIQIQTALSDGELDPNEKSILLLIAREIGFSVDQVEDLLTRWQAEFSYQQDERVGNRISLDDAYHLLGVTHSATDKELKRAYRKLMNEHHPDKLVAKGLPEEMMMLAKTKAQDIQAAYDRVKVERSLK